MKGAQIDMDEFLAFALACVEEDMETAKLIDPRLHRRSILQVNDGTERGQQAALFIAEWSPGKVMMLCTRLRLMIEEFSFEGRETTMLIELVTALYADRPGWREEWGS